MAKLSLVFLGRRSQRQVGSQLLRMNQMAEHMRRHFGHRYDVSTAWTSHSDRIGARAMRWRAKRDTVYVFSKFASSGWSDEHLELLRNKSRAILVDYVDIEIDRIKKFGVDCHLSCTYAGADAIRLKQKADDPAADVAKVRTVLHCADQAVLDLKLPESRNAFKCCYLGSPAMRKMPDEIVEDIDNLDASSATLFSANIGVLPNYSAHYAARPFDWTTRSRSYRPFTKGATAAAMEAPILVERGADDVVTQLGEDYPFFAEDNSDSAIIEAWDYFKSEFGSAAWRDAVGRMRDLKHRTSPQSVCAQLDEAILSVSRSSEF